ncbi:MAG: hypothetical protein SWK76_16950 [Actinomycetota bacterium]|nr:hypothetical protein [Actinomycetota bacterium]
MSEDYVPRPEFELFCTQQNDNVKEIKDLVSTGFAGVNEKLDSLKDDMSERVTWDAHDRHKQECKDRWDKLEKRWPVPVVVLMSLLTSIVVGLTVLLVTGVIG